MRLGCIADDFTGATDLAGLLRRSGASVTLHFGLPTQPCKGDADIEIIALKCRTEPVETAIEASLKAGQWLLDGGAEQLYWKYCSTFDSTPEGNIGPVAEALMQLTGYAQALYCPAFPENGRSVYMGHLFVGETLLGESSMKDHPLTPMTESSLANVLRPQVRAEVGLWTRGAQVAGHALPSEAHIIADAVEFADLERVAEAGLGKMLLTGGSALAMPLPKLLGLDRTHNSLDPHMATRSLVLSGSCSAMTQQQVATFSATEPSLHIDPLTIDATTVAHAMAWLKAQNEHQTPMIYATADPNTVRKAQDTLGIAEAGALIERTLASIAVAAYEHGFQRLVVAGGETSGAITQALGVEQVSIGSEICPGVPWVYHTESTKPLALALKSGNFGQPTFFFDALKPQGSH